MIGHINQRRIDITSKLLGKAAIFGPMGKQKLWRETEARADHGWAGM